MVSHVDKVAYAFNELKITRRIGFYFSLWMTWYAVSYCIEFATVAIANGVATLDVAAIIAAILVPISGLQGFALNAHHRGHADALSR